MNTSESLVRTLLIFAKILVGSLLLFQVSSCDLEVIPALQGLKSNFSFVVQNPTCTSNCLVTFTNASENATSYKWDFGDETTPSTEKDPQHTYVNVGTYNVKLIAKRDTIESDTTIAVTVGATTSTLSAGFTFVVQDLTCTANCAVVFTNTSQNATSYEWDFGDGSSISTEKDPQHTFINTGTYSVTLTAKKNMDSDAESMTVAVNPPAALVAMKHTVTTANADAQRTRLDYSTLNNNTSKIIVASAELGTTNLRNASALGMYYFSNKWHIFNQSTSPMVVGEIYNILISDPADPNAFVHQVSMANLFSPSISDLDHPSANGKPDARLFVTAVWEKSTDFNNHALGVVFFNNRWHVMNMDGSDLPVGMKINVIVNTTNSASFVHTTSSASISSDYSAIDHFVSNVKPNAKIFVTPYQGTSIFPVVNQNVVGLWYSTSRTKWTVFNESGFAMQQNASFNILVAE